MSFIYNNSVKYSDSPNLDAFGRLRVSEITSTLEVSHIYDKSPRIVDEVTGGTVTSDFDVNNSQVIMSGTGANSYVIRQTFNHGIYQPGKSEIFEASFSNFQLETDVIKRVGYFDSTTGSTYSDDFDGFFLESNGVTNDISFQIWKKGSLTYASSQWSWNSDEIDPLSIDWTNTNLMITDFQWLGVGRVRFGLVLSGLTYYFTEFSPTGINPTVYMTSPNKPIRYELRTDGGTGSLNMICSQVSMEGSLNQLVMPIGILGPISQVTFTTSGVKYPFIGVKVSVGYEDISLILENIVIMNTSNDSYYCTIEIDPPIIGSYTFSASTQPEVMKSICDGSQTITATTSEIYAAFLGNAGTTTPSVFELLNSSVNPGSTIDGRAQELWICITPLGANATFFGTANLYYRK
jgi:hypothetical protein